MLKLLMCKERRKGFHCAWECWDTQLVQSSFTAKSKLKITERLLRKYRSNQVCCMFSDVWNAQGNKGADSTTEEEGPCSKTPNKSTSLIHEAQVIDAKFASGRITEGHCSLRSCFWHVLKYFELLQRSNIISVKEEQAFWKASDH